MEQVVGLKFETKSMSPKEAPKRPFHHVRSTKSKKTPVFLSEREEVPPNESPPDVKGKKASPTKNL